MYAPLVFGSVRNAVWEPLFGIGFFFAGYCFHPYHGNRIVGLLGGSAWPLIVCTVIAFGGWRFTGSSLRTRLVACALFLASLVLWVPLDTVNRLVSHGVPFYSNLSSVWY